MLAMLSRRERLEDTEDEEERRQDDEQHGEMMDNDNDMTNIEPSAVPPYWSFSTTRTQLVERPPRVGEIPAVRTSSASATAWDSQPPASSGIDQDSVLPTMASLLAARTPQQQPPAPYINLPSLHSGNGDRQQQHQADDISINTDPIDEDDDDPSKGLASGPNALPVSPPRRIRRLPAVHQLLDTSSGGEGSEDSCGIGCPAGRCTCSRRSSPAPLSLPGSVSPTAASSSSATSPTSASKGKRKRHTSYIRKCSYLQPGVVFTGSQSFTTFANAYSNSSYPGSVARDHHRRNAHGHQYTYLGREPDPLYIAQPGVPSRRFLDSALDQLQTLTRHATASLNRSPFSSLIPTSSSSSALSPEPESAWSAIEGSAIDPSMQDLLAGNPSYGYTSGDSIARASSTEEWEVQVSISSVDYIQGKVTGIMTALNVPNSLDVPPTPSSVGPSSASLANGLDASNTVTTSFEGEIIDLRNNGLWTRNSPNEGAMDASHSDMFEDDDEEAASYASGSSSSCTGGPWLSSSHVVDKSTDLDYWAKLDAFASYGPLAEKEICKIAREGKWPEQARNSPVRRPNPQDYILMRWKGESTPLRCRLCGEIH